MLVLWRDSSTSPGWKDGAKAVELRPLRCLSAGWVVGLDKESLLLYHTVSEDGGTLDALAIPRGCIVKIEKVHAKGNPLRKVLEEL